MAHLISLQETSITLPEGWKLRAALTPPPHDAIDIDAELKKGLKTPIGASSPINYDYRGKNVCVVIDDATRPTPVNRIFPTLLNTLLEAGASGDRLTVLVANGTHAPMSKDAIFNRLGVTGKDKINVVNHDAQDESILDDLGVEEGLPLKINRLVTASDIVFSIGTIEPHIMAGFGGGYKNIVPGCACLATVSATHLFGPAASRFGSVGRFPEDCAVRRRIDAAAKKAVPNCFIINTVLDPDNAAVGLFCGEPMEAHHKGCELAREVWGAPLKEKADILLASGYPMTHDLCQASKAFSTGIDALREGGMVLLVLRCHNGLGDYCVSPTNRSYEETKTIVRGQGTEGYVEAKRKERGENGFSESMPFYETFLTQSNSEALRKADIYVTTPDIPFETLSGFGLFKAFASVEAMIEEARLRFPAADVVLSPSGGTCFPYFK
ncbi:hypothetical protein FACS1894187_16440 [Synergistales bacterium]|nr:hypothetical protein FACS1894187_16440 [Synergistales bacterium]